MCSCSLPTVFPNSTVRTRAVAVEPLQDSTQFRRKLKILRAALVGAVTAIDGLDEELEVVSTCVPKAKAGVPHPPSFPPPQPPWVKQKQQASTTEEWVEPEEQVREGSGSMQYGPDKTPCTGQERWTGWAKEERSAPYPYIPGSSLTCVLRRYSEHLI